ncbi:MAG: B12-binding domain-containing radical SAM protein [Planctomycetota bacterium]
MRVLFIYPSIDSPPGINHGLAAISGVLKEQGHDTRLIHVCEGLWPIPGDEEIARIVREYRPGLIGFSVMSQQYRWACDASRALREEFDIPQVIGGVHCTMVPDEVTADEIFDFVCVGEGDHAMLELVERLERGEDTTTIPNLRMVRDGRTIVNPVGAFPDLDRLPAKDYDLFEMGHILNVKKGWLSIITSRGCPYKCTYCFNKEIVDLYKEEGGARSAKEYLRHYSIERILGEVRRLKEAYPQIETVIFDDDLFTLKRRYVQDFCRAYGESGIGLRFVVNAHFQQFDDDMARPLAAAGCRIVKFGLESGSDRVRREVLWRFMTNKKILEGLRAAHRHGLHTSCFIMIGLPTETREEVMETLRMCAEAKMGRFRWAIFFPFPGTAGYRIAEEMGLIEHEKMQGMGNYFDASCLRFGPEHDLFLEKVGTLCNWYVNALSDWPSAPTYQALVDQVDRMGRTEWRRFKEEALQIDRDHSERFLEKAIPHYSIRYSHVMGVHSDFILWEREQLRKGLQARSVTYTLD